MEAHVKKFEESEKALKSSMEQKHEASQKALEDSYKLNIEASKAERDDLSAVVIFSCTHKL